MFHFRALPRFTARLRRLDPPSLLRRGATLLLQGPAGRASLLLQGLAGRGGRVLQGPATLSSFSRAAPCSYSGIGRGPSVPRRGRCLE